MLSNEHSEWFALGHHLDTDTHVSQAGEERGSLHLGNLGRYLQMSW